jgi:hypothetical protein
MTKVTVFFLSLFIFISCIDQFNFKNSEVTPSLVVEGFISDISYNESLLLPNDGRYFSIKLKYTSIVKNIHDEIVYDAVVRLISDDGFYWNYTPEYVQGNFQYLLKDADFHVESGKKYKIQIILSNGDSYESDFQGIEEARPIGDISFEETVETKPKFILGEMQLVTVKGINVYIDIPKSDTPTNYRWDLLPSWIFVAPNASELSPYKTCWVTGQYYLRDFILANKTRGGYKEKLAFIETSSNERIAFELTLFVRQHVINDQTFQFWSEIKDQTTAPGLFDSPPYNVSTNIKPIGHDTKVYGFFGVHQESSRRWYFTPNELSYTVSFQVTCDPRPPPFDSNVCLNCMAVSNGDPINQKPNWWR